MKVVSWCLLLGTVCVGITPVFARLSVVEQKGELCILRDGKPFIEAVRIDCGAVDLSAMKTSYVLAPTGAKTWNRWCEQKDRAVRLEVAERTDGAIEVTFAGQVPFDSAVKRRWVRLAVAKGAFENGPWESVKSASGRYWYEQRGTFDAAFKTIESRWFATDGLTFDFNPLGPGDDYAFGRASGWRYMDTYAGEWDVVRRKDGGLSIETGGDVTTTWGGFFGTKLVIREGSFRDYDSIHPLRVFSYAIDFEPLRLMAFGSPKRGAAYSEGNVLYSETRGYGWTEDDPWERNPAVGYSEGAYYSAFQGVKPETYRFGNLPDGFYLFTFAAGNYGAVSNRFSVCVNDEPLFTKATIPVRQVRRITKAIHVTGGRLEVSFEGAWLVSVLGLQHLLSDAEDFSFTRKPWHVDGFEPGLLQINADITRPVALSMRDVTEALPVPGTECQAPVKELVREVELPNPLSTNLAWTHDARIYRLFNNSSLMHELDAPGALKTYLDRELAGKDINAIMLSGMLSRHTFVGHRERGLQAVKRIVEEAHRRGIRVIDHFDATLLWNAGHGFRVMAETVPQLNISKMDHLPAFQYCIMNPEMREWFMRYVEDDARNGVDGFQLDEVQFWWHGCVCEHCRAAFERDTGWKMPLNECDAAWSNDRTPFMQKWYAWRAIKATDFLIEARRRCKVINLDLVFSAYSTPWGYTWRFGECRLGRNYLDLARTVNFFGIEVMSRCVMKGVRSELVHRRSQNPVMLEYGAPMWDWYYNADWQNDYVAWAISSMTGHSPLLAEVDPGDDVPDYPRFDVSKGAMDRRGARPIARVGLLFSSCSRDWNREVKFRDDLLGTGQALEARHIPYEVLGEMSLKPERLAKYKVLFIGAAHCIDDAGVAAIRDFAAKGGIVRLSTLAGLCNETGEARAAWPFHDVFGFEPRVDLASTELITRPFGKGMFIYSPAPRGEPFCMPEISPPYPMKFEPDVKAQSAFWDEVARWAAPARWWQITAPEKVYTSIWRERTGALVIHFLNTTGVTVKPWVPLTPEAPSPAFPALTEDIVFTIPEGEKAVATSPDFVGTRALKSTKNVDGSLTVTLPKELLKVYALVRVQGVAETK